MNNFQVMFQQKTFHNVLITMKILQDHINHMHKLLMH
jgi:hypothetical protein